MTCEQIEVDIEGWVKDLICEVSLGDKVKMLEILSNSITEEVNPLSEEELRNKKYDEADLLRARMKAFG